MKLNKCFKLALNMVLHSRLRSWLTILGIVIGVASVISIVAIGDGMSSQLESQMGVLEADIITITPGYSKAITFGPGRDHDLTSSSASDAELTNKDIQTLKAIYDIELISPKISGSVEITYLGKKGKVTLTGVDQKVYSKISSTDILEGRNLDSADANVIIIGKRLAQTYFEKPIGINQMLTIEGRNFRVVGILDDSSTSSIYAN